MIKKFIDSIAYDKKDHVILGLIYGFFFITILSLIGSIFGRKWKIIGATIGFIISTLLVAAKEIINDWLQGKGKPEFNDFVASEIPIIAIYLNNLI